MYCEKCGSYIENDDARFCPECGASITAPTETPAPTEMPAPTAVVEPTATVTLPPAPETSVPSATTPEKKQGRLLPLIIILVVVLLAAIGTVCAVFLPDWLANDDTDGNTTPVAVTTTTVTLYTDATVTAAKPSAVVATSVTTATTTTTTARTTTTTAAPSYPAASNDRIVSITSTSYLDETELGFVHKAECIADHDLTTAWVEGASGVGVGEKVTMQLSETCRLSGFTVYAGYQKSSDQYYRNARPKKIGITFSDLSYQECELRDTFGAQTVTFNQPVNTSSFTVTIVSVYPGEVFEDTAISEIALF